MGQRSLQTTGGKMMSPPVSRGGEHKRLQTTGGDETPQSRSEKSNIQTTGDRVVSIPQGDMMNPPYSRPQETELAPDHMGT